MLHYEDSEEEEENPYLAGREDYLLRGTDGGPRATAYDVMETANIRLRLLVAVGKRLVGHGGRYGRLRAQAVSRQLGEAGLGQAKEIFKSIKRYGLLALGELFQGLLPIWLEVDVVKRILGYAGYPEEPQLDPLGAHYYQARGAWGGTCMHCCKQLMTRCGSMKTVLK